MLSSFSAILYIYIYIYRGDLGINNKTPNRMLTRRLSHTKCINTSLRIGSTNPSGQKSKRKIIKINVAYGKLSRQKIRGMVERRFLEPAGRGINLRFCEPRERIKRDQKDTDTVIKREVKFALELRTKNYFSASDYYLTIEKEDKE